ncbi:MAG: hypothetical protein FJZ01_20480 [Candidatus Sericytochromatia bacterium]|nr:hypothetical protein [Candidatus Tanganyikabacteria bacterium]
MASGLSPVGGSGVDPVVATLAPAVALRTVGGAGAGFLTVSGEKPEKAAQAGKEPVATAATVSLLAVSDASADAASALSALSGSVAAFSPASPVADFGSLRIDGVTTVLGAVDSRYMTTADAANYVAATINSNRQSTVTASVADDGRLELRGRDGGAFFIEAIGALTTDQSAQAIDLGLTTGRFEDVARASHAIAGPTFARSRKSHSGGLDTSGGERREQAAATTAADQAAAVARQAQEAARSQAAAPAISASKGAIDERLSSLLEAPDVPRSVKSGDVEITAARTRPGQVGEAIEPAPLIADLAAAKADRAAGLTVAQHVAQQGIQAVVADLEPPEAEEEEDEARPGISFEV